jgi:curved DNA-binding protein
MTTHYETLGVSKSATPDEIKKAYRKLASQHHPDKGGDTAKFQQIEEAYRILSDPNQRQQYDNPQHQSFRFNTSDFDGMPPGFEDIFRNFGFGHGSPFGQHRQAQPRRNKDLKVNIQITLAETLSEQQKTLSVKTTTGRTEIVEVTIPRGVDQSVIKYPGLGDDCFNTLSRGDLYVHVNVIADPRFNLNGLDLITRQEINCLQAMAGGEIEVEGLDGKKFVLTVPAGTQHGNLLRIRNEGLYASNYGMKGNLLVELAISIPRNLSEEQLNLVRQIQSSL